VDAKPSLCQVTHVSSPHPPLPLGPGVRVLHAHPAGLIALEKPAGLLSHPNTPAESPRSLLTTPYDPDQESYALDDGKAAHLIHRLDSATSGVLLIALDPTLATLIRQRFAGREVEKHYAALVFGVPRRRHESWRDQLHISHQQGRLRTTSAAAAEGDAATCDMTQLRIITGQPVLTLLQLQPHTGRSHQLRVQCQKRHLPIVGDATYGDFAKNRLFAQKTGHKRLFLHAHRVTLTFPWAKQTQYFTAESPLPPEFNRPR
jgi:tRNA pseudouridine65 synthase